MQVGFLVEIKKSSIKDVQIALGDGIHRFSDLHELAGEKNPFNWTETDLGMSLGTMRMELAMTPREIVLYGSSQNNLDG